MSTPAFNFVVTRWATKRDAAAIRAFADEHNLPTPECSGRCSVYRHYETYSEAASTAAQFAAKRITHKLYKVNSARQKKPAERTTSTDAERAYEEASAAFDEVYDRIKRTVVKAKASKLRTELLNLFANVEQHVS